MDPEDDPLRAPYLAYHQGRFKAAVNRFHRELQASATNSREVAGSPPPPLPLLLYLFAFFWLRHEVADDHRGAILAVSRNPDHAYLEGLLRDATSGASFVEGYLRHWLSCPEEDPRGEAVRRFVGKNDDSLTVAVAQTLESWQRLGRYPAPPRERRRRLQARQKRRMAEVLGESDRERLALLDALPQNLEKGGGRFSKLAIVPRYSCPESCRHCLFVWRPPLRATWDTEAMLRLAGGITDNLLFTGGDLWGDRELFHRAVTTMGSVVTFAILLNGSTATTPGAARALFQGLATALLARSRKSRKAQILLQVSFDEFHQEIVVDRRGDLAERIAVANIANLVEASVAFPGIQLVLLHKQNRLNFSEALFRQGVVARLIGTLAARGRRLRVETIGWSAHSKADPVIPGRMGPVIREALFVLADAPTRPIAFFSSIIDAMGRGSLVDRSEYVAERESLAAFVDHGVVPAEAFDTDLMFGTDGKVTLFAANHYSLGNVATEGWERILGRYRADPLLPLLRNFDRRILELYRLSGGDVATLVARATSPHHLWYRLTASAERRLAMTRLCLAATGEPGSAGGKGN
ncbi:MAG: hypothetical protein HQL59_03460 [Magnetococcales bacterium]|nr:hypothetical protein [Magnetococcales bacterium]